MSLAPGSPSIFCCVLLEMRPASAREPPDGSSTTVFAWRVSNTGFCPMNLRDIADAGIDLEADAAFREHDRREAQLDTEFLERDRTHSGLRINTRDVRNFAAGEELGRLAGNGGQVRFCQRPNQAIAFERANG